MKVTPQIVKLVQSGALYMLGRDKHYRVTIIFDLTKIIEIQAVDPEAVNA